jgi:hypothetical protein
LWIPRILDLEIVADARADGGDHGPDLVVRQNLVDPCALGVQDLALEGQDRLILTVTAHLGAVVDEHARRQRKIVCARHLEVADVHRLRERLDAYHLVVVMADGLESTGLVPVKIPFAEGLEGKHARVTRRPPRFTVSDEIDALI